MHKTILLIVIFSVVAYAITETTPCRWTCEEVSCNTTCTPVCTKPSCNANCTDVESSNPCDPVKATYHCASSDPTDSCPACDVVAEPPVCHVPQGTECEILCEEIECSWDCSRKTPCDLPHCYWDCTSPSCSCQDGGNCSGASQKTLSLFGIWIMVYFTIKSC